MNVLTYHKVTNKLNFEKQIKYLSRNYEFIGALSKLIPSKQKILLTADDGDPSFYHNAFPILKKFKIPAILFIITDLINTNKPFWWDEIEYYLGKEGGGKKVWEVKSWPNIKREMYLEHLRESSDKPEMQYVQLTTSQLREMQDSGIIIANHSHTHPMFDKCTLEELEKEMHRSTMILKELNFTPDVFAYPNGNYSPVVEMILNKYGVNQTFLFDHKINKRNINPLRISRLKINDDTPLWKLKLILSGWHSNILPVTRAIGKFYRKFT